jgi:quinol monooxygenase YgiN
MHSGSLTQERDALSTSVRMTVRWFVPPPELGSIASALHALMVEMRDEPGWLRSQLTTEMGRRVELRYVEEWREERDLRRQIRSNRFARLAGLIDQATEEPRVEFALGARYRGLDYAEEVRQGDAT